jgi:hypothetical protein
VGPRIVEEQSCNGGLQDKVVVVVDDTEEYTINDDLNAFGLPGEDKDDLASDARHCSVALLLLLRSMFVAVMMSVLLELQVPLVLLLLSCL